MAFNRVHLDGVLGSGIEQWSVGVAFATSGGGAVSSPSDLTAWANGIMGAWAGVGAWAVNLRQMLGASSRIDRVRIYHYPSPGADATALGISTAATVAGTGTVTFPFQSSLVFTLQTQIPGRSYRGRAYWPLLTGSMSSGGQTGDATINQNRAEYFADYLLAVTTAAPTPSVYFPQVVSVAKGAVTPVTSVRVGNVVDTQRRRRDAVPETFYTATFP